MTNDAHTHALAATRASRSSPGAAHTTQNAHPRHPRRRSRHLRHLWEAATGTQRRSSRRGRRVRDRCLAHPREEVQLVLGDLRAPPGGGRWGDRGVASRPSSDSKTATWRAVKLTFASHLPTREEVVEGCEEGQRAERGRLAQRHRDRDVCATGRVHRARAEGSLPASPVSKQQKQLSNLRRGSPLGDR